MRVNILGIPFDSVTLPQAVELASKMLDEPRPHRVVTPNPEIVWKCRNNPDAMRAVSGADLILADGIGVVRASRTLGKPLPERVPGFEWATQLVGRIAREGRRLYLLGGKPGVAGLAAEKLAEKFRQLIVCGFSDGYFKDRDAVIEQIRGARPDVIFVCTGAPAQELFMEYAAPRIGNVLMAGLGGSIDVWAGTLPRAPAFFCRIGMEWFWRALRQPSRIPRLFIIPRFMRAVKVQKRSEREP